MIFGDKKLFLRNFLSYFVKSLFLGTILSSPSVYFPALDERSVLHS
jgi:hypothetical protein